MQSEWTDTQRDAYWEELCQRFPRVPAELEFVEGSQAGPFKSHGSSVLSCKFSPDGKYVASAGGGRIPGCDDSIRIWDAKIGNELLVCRGHTCGIYALAFDPVSGLLASASEDYSVILWNLKKRDAIFLEGGPPVVKGHVAFAANGRLLAIGETEAYDDETSSIHVVDLASGKETFRHDLAENDAISAMAISSTGNHLLFAVQDFHAVGDTIVWCYDVQSSTVIWKQRFTESAVTDMYFSRDEGMAVACIRTDGESYECQLGVIDLGDGTWDARFTTPGITLATALSPVDDVMVCADEKGNVDLLQLPSMTKLSSLTSVEPEAEKYYCSAQFSPDGTKILIGDAKGGITVFKR